MGSKDRILRQKEETRKNILDAAYCIAKEEGWKGLSMRKIADKIEYTAPIIYEYFSNKDAILKELTIKGFIQLTKNLEQAKSESQIPEEQLEKMWMAYWDFAFEDKELYQVMYGVQMNCCTERWSVTVNAYNLFGDVIAKIMEDSNPSEELIRQKYFTFFSVFHGLISVNMVGDGLPQETNSQILKDAIGGIMRSLK
jgi:AcrR family transcriptional regulator